MAQRAVRTITPPASEPVTLAQAKLHVRQDLADDDTLIATLITTARETVEAESWHALMTQTLELVLDAWPSRRAIELPRPPLQSVQSITLTDDSGQAIVWSPSSYHVDSDSIPGRIVLAAGASWPSVTLAPVGGIRIRYVAGWASAGLVPTSLTQAMLLLIGHWYENREATGRSTNEIARGVKALLWRYRMAVMP